MQPVRCLAAITLLVTTVSAAQEPPPVRVVRFERLLSNPESTAQFRGRELGPIPAASYEFKDGVYRSVFSRITLRVPRIDDEKLVDVREAIPMVRADKSPATTHVMFDPDGTRFSAPPDAAISAVVVSRMREDRPTDPDSVLDRLDGGPQKRAELAAMRGIQFDRIETKLGPALQRVMRNRARDERFPYTLALLNDAGATTYGVTTYVVAGSDSLVEFSQIFPCGSRTEGDCRASALKAMQSFVAGVSEFRTYPPQPAAAPMR